MKKCPFCNTSNDDDAFCCRECDSPISTVPREPDSSSGSGKSGLSLAEEETRRKPPTRPITPGPEGSHYPPPGWGDRAEGGSWKPPGFGQQQGPARPKGNFLTVFLFTLAVLFGGMLVYLVLFKNVLKEKDFFDKQLAQIEIEHAARVGFLESEIEGLRAQRDHLMADLSKSKEKYDADIVYLQGKLNELIEGKLPGKRAIRTGEAVTIVEKGMKFIVEFPPGGPAENVLRYRLTLENIQGSPLRPPPIELIIFNESGLQIGASSIAVLDRLAPEQIESGGARVTMGSIRLTPAGEPGYFLIVFSD